MAAENEKITMNGARLDHLIEHPEHINPKFELPGALRELKSRRVKPVSMASKVEYHNDYLLINGKEFNTLLGITGLSLASDEVTDFIAYYGCDGYVEEMGNTLEPDDHIALADAMIERWQLYKEIHGGT